MQTHYPTVFVDGAYLPSKEARVSIFDRGFLMSDGVFETLHVQQGVPLHLEAHFTRLRRSASALSMDVPWSDERLREMIRGLIERNLLSSLGAPDAALRITLTRGIEVSGTPTLVMTLRRLTSGHLAKRSDGVHLFGLRNLGRQAHLAQHKTLSYLSSALGRLQLEELTDSPRAEGLFVSDTGAVLEGTSSNVFIFKNGELITAPVASGVLMGIARGLVLELAQATPDVTLVAERNFDVAELRAADEVFITASTLHVAAGVSFDDRPIGRGVEGPVYRALKAAYSQRVDREVAEWYGA